MDDRIVEGYLKDFTNANDLKDLSESEAFEHFINYCIVSREHPENFDYEAVSVGETGGLDGIAVLVNEHIVNSKEEVDFFQHQD